MRGSKVVGSLILVLGFAPAQAASFDCAKASAPVEKLICGNQKVSELDEHLGRYYAAARAELGAAKSCLALSQRAWIKGRNTCADATCLERFYLRRLAELDPLQPGASALKNVELPRVKSLVWIIPPAEDQVAAPRVSAGVPFQVRGRVLDETAAGDGFLIQDAKGVKHPLLLLMFMNKSSGVRLETLAHETGAIFEATGFQEKAPDGTGHFAPGGCITIHRLPPD
jgi:uncharacterized protein